MSECVDCGELMDAMSAREYENCPDCWKRHGQRRVRTIYRPHSEDVGRKARSTKTIGGCAEMNDDGDIQEEDTA